MINKTKGSIYVIISAWFFASYGVWSHFMMGVFGKFSQAWIKGLLLLVIVGGTSLVLKKIKKVDKADWKWFGLIAMAGGLNQAPYYYGFEHLNIGTATLLFYVSLVMGTYLIGRIFFGEFLSSIKVFALLMSIVGLGFIYKFTMNPSQLIPALVTIVAGFLGAVGGVFTKKLSGKYSELQVLMSYFVVMFLANLLMSLMSGESVPLLEWSTAWLALLMYSVSMLIANLFVILGFKNLDPSVCGLLGMLEVVFAVLIGVALFGEVMSLQMILGCGLILFAVSLPDGWELMRKIAS